MTKQSFNPEEYLIQLKGNDYLEVKWRLFWFREIYPNGNIKTEILEHVPGDYALVRATVTKQNDNQMPEGIATGHKMVSAKKNTNYLEFAETGAIGRALGILGFGTEFSGNDYSSTDEPGSTEPTPIRQTAKPEPVPATQPAVDTETGEILDDDDEPVMDDPDAIISADIAEDMKQFVIEQIEAGAIQQDEVTHQVQALNETKRRISDLTNREAGQFEQWLYGVLEERGAGQ